MNFYPLFPDEYEKSILEFFNYDPLKLATYSKEVKTLSDIFLNKKIISDYFKSGEFLRAYSFYYFPQNYIKTRYLLSILSPVINKKKKINILDFGAGPGNSTFAARDFAKGKDYKIFYFDKQKEGYDFLKSIDKDENIIKIESDDFKEKQDIIIFSYTLKEIGKNIINIIKKLKKNSKEDTVFIFLDAPDPEVLKLINNIKKEFIKDGFNIIYPCRNRDCPILKLKEEERTCYTQIEWVIPNIVSEINRKLFFRIKYLKFSSLIVSKNISPIDYLFAISPYIGEKGKGKVYFCSGGGRIEAELLKKEITENNKEFLNIKRGTAVDIELPSVKNNKVRLSKETKVSIINRII
jgi:SAM-dependent methyltransferase